MVDCHFSYITEMRKKNSPPSNLAVYSWNQFSFWPHWYQWHQQHLELDVSPTVHILKWWTLTFHAHLPQTMHLWSELYIIWPMWLSWFCFFSCFTWNPSNKLNANACKIAWHMLWTMVGYIIYHGLWWLSLQSSCH